MTDDKVAEALALIKEYKIKSVNGSIQIHFSSGVPVKLHATQVS